VQCAKVEEQLSEYIDDLLDTPVRSLVDAHLQNCPACHKTLEELKTLVRDLGDLEPVSAPPDFFDKVQQRLLKRSWARRIFEALFVPPLVKLPLQFAAVAVMAILVITISYRITPETEVARRSDETGQKEVVSEPAKDTYKPMKQDQPKVAESGEQGQIVQEEIIELALVLNQVTVEPVRDEKSGSAEKSKKQLSPSMPSSPAPATLNQNELQLTPQKSEMEHAKQEEKTATASDSDRGFVEIQSLTNRLNGTIIESAGTAHLRTHHEEETITVKIPFTSYNQFLEALRQLGSVQGVTGNVTVKGNQTITIRIRVAALD